MVRINKAECSYIRERFPKTFIAVTNRQAPSKKKTWYMEENKAAMKALKEFRNRQG